METIFIYGLFDPDFPEVLRYIGQTANFEKRLKQHRSAPSNSWILESWRNLVQLHGRQVEARILHAFHVDDRKAEQRFILDTEASFIRKEAAVNPYLLNQPFWSQDKVRSGIPRCLVRTYQELVVGYVRAIKRTGDWWPAMSCIREIEGEFPRLDIFPCHFHSFKTALAT